MSSQDLAAPAEFSRLLGSDYWCAVPLRTAAVGSQHRAGLRATVIRAGDENAAPVIAAGDPFVRAGLRTFTVRRWRLNQSSVGIRVSLGTPSPTSGSSRRQVTPGRQRCTESA